MRLYVICFSPTGGTRAVTAALAGAWGPPAAEVDLSDPAWPPAALPRFGREDVCLIGVPSFGGRVPAAALERLGQLRAEGAAAVLTAVYGNRAYDDTLLELLDAAAACGFRPVAAVGAVAEHSIVRQYGAGRPDGRDRSELRRFGETIRAGLEAGALTGPLSVPGTRPFRAYGGVPLKPKAGRSCTACGACAARCPVGAIPAARPGETDADRCISCMRCVQVCPAGARTLNRAMLLAVGQKLKKACAERKANELFLAKSPD